MDEQEQNRKKKLLIATDGFPPRWDGIARFLSEVIPKIKDNFDITVIAPISSDFEDHIDRPEGYTLIRVPTHNWRFGDYYPARFKRKSRKIIKTAVQESDFVWVHSVMPIGVMAIHQARKHNKPCIAYIHVIDWDIVLKSLKIFKPLRYLAAWLVKIHARHWYNKCSILIVPSIDVANLLTDKGIKTQKTVVHLGTNVDRFTPPDSKDSAKIRIGIEPHKQVIGFIGRMSREKDISTLYRAFYQLSKKRKNLLLLLVGAGLAEITDPLKDKPNIIVTGQKNNVVPYFQAMDVYVLPSLTETTSLSTLEAMSCGLTVISTRVGFVKKYIKDKYNGLFFPAGNSFVLRKKIENVLDDDKQREILGHNARKTVMLNFSWNKTIEEIENILNSF